MKKNVLFSVLCIAGMLPSLAQTTQDNRLEPSSQTRVARQAEALQLKARTRTENMRAIPVMQTGRMQTVASKNAGNGVTIELVKDNKGNVYRQLRDRNRNTLKISNPAMARVTAATQGTTFLESFEGYTEDKGTDWIPEGWEEINAEGNVPMPEININNTWYVSESTGSMGFLPITPYGRYECFVHFSYDIEDQGIKAVDQDEWLITPSITPQEGDNLYFAAAINYGNVYNSAYFDWGTYTYSKRETVYNLIVMVSVDGGEWEELWNAEKEIVSKMTDSEIYAEWGLEYRDYKADLSKYTGKNIKVAFRYIRGGGGFEGDSMILDQVLVGSPRPGALYKHPDGFFLMGYDKQMRATAPTLFGPAYIENTWINQSSTHSETFEWSTTDPEDIENGGTVSTTDRDLIVAYPFSSVPVPELTARIAGAEDSVYVWNKTLSDEMGAVSQVIHGGNTTVTFEGDDTETVLGAGNYDWARGMAAWTANEDGDYLFGKPSDQTMWSGELDGIASSYTKPSAKYTISNIWLTLADFDADDDAEIQLIVHRLIDNQMADTIATAKCLGAEVEKLTIDGVGTLYNMPFALADSKTGEKGVIEIEDAIFVEIKGFTSDKIRSLAPLNQYEESDYKEVNSYGVVIQEDYDGNITRNFLTLTDFYSPFMLGMDVAYPFMVSEKTIVNIPLAGGSQEVNVNSFYKAEAWQIEDTLPEWLKAEGIDAQDGSTVLKVTAEPSDTERTAEIKVTVPGAEMTLTVKQNGTAVESHEAEAVTATVQGDVIVLTYNEGIDSVSVADAEGRTVANYNLPEGGHFAIPASALAKGMYILRFNDNTVVKVIK